MTVPEPGPLTPQEQDELRRDPKVQRIVELFDGRAGRYAAPPRQDRGEVMAEVTRRWRG